MADGNRQQTWFPFDMVAEILLRLPVKSLKQFQCVCKTWCDLISDSCFVMEHANRAKKGTKHLKLLVSMQPPESVDYEALLEHEGDGHVVAIRRLELDLSRYPFPETSRNDLVYIVGSCNGLICLHGVRRVIDPNHQDFILVWNPSTGDTCKLPEHPSFIDDYEFESHHSRLLPMLYGFGYDSSTEDYKVILGNMSSDNTECRTQILLFTLKTGSWRSYEECRKVEKEESVRLGGQGCLSNGALHWIELVFDDEGLGRSRILSFDLAEEKFQEMVSLSSFVDREYLDDIKYSYSDIFIGIGSTIENCLHVYFYHRRGRYTNDTILTIWMLIEKSWTKILRIPLKISVPRENTNKYLLSEPTYTMNDYIFPIHILEHGEVLMSCDGNMLVLYNPKEKTNKTVLRTALSSHAVVYVETLISPRIGISNQHDGEEEEASRKLKTSCLSLNKEVLRICRKPWMLKTRA